MSCTARTKAILCILYVLVGVFDLEIDFILFFPIIKILGLRDAKFRGSAVNENAVFPVLFCFLKYFNGASAQPFSDFPRTICCGGSTGRPAGQPASRNLLSQFSHV